MKLQTARLEILAATAQTARADIVDGKLFSSLLNARVLQDWPPAEFKDAQPIFARYLERSPELAGWLHWYWIIRSERMLIGSGGFGGKPDKNGKIELGFSVIDSYHGQGYGTEAVRALLEWASAQPDVKKIVAAAEVDNYPSRRVLQKCGFQTRSTSDSGTVEYELFIEKE